MFVFNARGIRLPKFPPKTMMISFFSSFIPREINKQTNQPTNQPTKERTTISISMQFPTRSIGAILCVCVWRRLEFEEEHWIYKILSGLWYNKRLSLCQKLTFWDFQPITPISSAGLLLLAAFIIQRYNIVGGKTQQQQPGNPFIILPLKSKVN